MNQGGLPERRLPHPAPPHMRVTHLLKRSPGPPQLPRPAGHPPASGVHPPPSLLPVHSIVASAAARTRLPPDDRAPAAALFTGRTLLVDDLASGGSGRWR